MTQYLMDRAQFIAANRLENELQANWDCFIVHEDNNPFLINFDFFDEMDFEN